MKIYDCSNSYSRPVNRGYGGPIENACVSMLKRYAFAYQAEFVTDIKSADVIFTNDVYPDEVRKLGKPMVKRMDGTFWQLDLQARNEPLNAAAAIADHVIFISEFSRKSLVALYGDVCKSYSIALNAVDFGTFHPIGKFSKHQPEIWIAAATHWGREEKRLQDIISFANEIGYLHDALLLLIGNLDPSVVLPYNVVNVGYIDSPSRLAKLLAKADAFVNFSYRDAAPKVVIEAVMCGLPILYANSGGVPEIVYGDSSVAVRDTVCWDFEQSTPKLDAGYVADGLRLFINKYPRLSESAMQYGNGTAPLYVAAGMLKEYFDTFRKVKNDSLQTH